MSILFPSGVLQFKKVTTLVSLLNGERIARNIHAPTKEECEKKLAELILEMQDELRDMRAEVEVAQPM